MDFNNLNIKKPSLAQKSEVTVVLILLYTYENTDHTNFKQSSCVNKHTRQMETLTRHQIAFLNIFMNSGT